MGHHNNYMVMKEKAREKISSNSIKIRIKNNRDE